MFCTENSEVKEQITLFIAIGSAPKNAALRQSARMGWLKWIPNDGSVHYRFYSDERRPVSGSASSRVVEEQDNEVWNILEEEVSTRNDIVLQPLDSGYGRTDDNEFGKRALFQLRWATNKFDFAYFLRIDDDSFLCLHKLLYELKAAPRRQFLWGRFWCREGRNRADENFLMLSEDVAKFVTDNENVGKIIPFDDKVTFGWNMGYLSWILNLTIFDDQTRLDSQQGYLTEHMHSADTSAAALFGSFCDDFIYAHHVHAAVMLEAFVQTKTRLMYPIPKITGPRETCPVGQQSFVPSRHSGRLPDVRVSAVNAV